jgi:hypothetical protein
LAAGAAALALLTTAAPAARKSSDHFSHAAYDTFQVRSIGMLPVAVLKPDNEAAIIMRDHLENALKPTGYRFLNQDLLHASARSAGLEDTLKVLEKSWQKGSLDTLALRALGAAHVADALLASTVTTWDRSTIDPTVAGYSITQIGVELALYSTRTGELLWRETLLEQGEGPYNNPADQNIVGVQGSSLGNMARTSTSLDPPSFHEIASKLERRVQADFPPMPKITPRPAPTEPPATPRLPDKFGEGEPVPGTPHPAG